VLSGLSLRDFSGPHFSKPELELGEKEIENPENYEGKVQTLHCSSFITSCKKFTSVFVIVPSLISQINAKFETGNARFLAGNHCH